MAQYKAIYLNSQTKFYENDSFSMTFAIMDENNEIIHDLSNYKFGVEITDKSNELKKKDANYSDGSSSQISVSGSKVTINVDADDTDGWEGTYICELQMTNKSTGVRYTVYSDNITLLDETLDW